MNKDTFINRVITLTSEKVALEHDYANLRQEFINGGFSSGTNRKLKHKIVNAKYAVDHVNSSIKINKYLADKE
jgi:hypothetical protein